MIWIARLAALLVFLPSLALAATAWFATDQIYAIVGLSEQTGLGLATVRGDVGAIFAASAIGSGLALFAGKNKAMLIPALIYGLVAFGRILDIGFSGVSEGEIQPIIVEFVFIALSLFAWKKL